MAIDHGKHNIRVNCVCPGDVDTPMLRSECAQLGQDEQSFMREAANRPLARVGTPEDVANAVSISGEPDVQLDHRRSVGRRWWRIGVGRERAAAIPVDPYFLFLAFCQENWLISDRHSLAAQLLLGARQVGLPEIA